MSATDFFVRRLGSPVLRAAALLFAASLFAFAICELMPGDTYSELRIDPGVAPASIGALRQDAGLNRPVALRYLSWLASLSRGDFGYSRSYRSPIAPLIAARAARTVVLTLAGLVASWALALPLGVWSAARSGRPDGRAVAVASTMLLGLPDLVIASMLLLAAAATGALATHRHLALPAIAIALSAAPALVRHVRASVLDVLGAPHILAALARGIPRRRIVCRSALRAAAAPLVPLFGLSFAALFSTAMIVEVVLGWPGIGPLLVDAVLSRDTPLVLAGVVASSLLLLGGNTLADLLLAFLDPRVEAA